MSPNASQSSRGFTLIELLTVIAIIGILAAILIPTVGKVRATARKAQCVSNLRQIGIGIQAFASDHKGLLPPSTTTDPSKDPAHTGMTGYIMWYRYINPYLNAKLYGLDADRKLIPQCPSYTAPVASTDGQYHHYTGYGYNQNVGNVYSSSAKLTYLHRVGTVSRFPIVFEVAMQAKGKFTDFSASDVTFRHANAGNVLMLDGHVETLKAGATGGTTFATSWPEYTWTP